MVLTILRLSGGGGRQFRLRHPRHIGPVDALVRHPHIIHFNPFSDSPCYFARLQVRVLDAQMAIQVEEVTMRIQLTFLLCGKQIPRGIEVQRDGGCMMYKE